MSPELEAHYKQTEETLPKAQKLFEPLHPFVAMMVLTEVIAHWLLEHPQKDHVRVLQALMLTTVDRLSELTNEDETVH